MKDIKTEREQKLIRLGENLINAKLHAKKRREADRRIVQVVRRNGYIDTDSQLLLKIREAMQEQDPTLEEFQAEVDKLVV